jgi:hypothetical protein
MPAGKRWHVWWATMADPRWTEGILVPEPAPVEQLTQFSVVLAVVVDHVPLECRITVLPRRGAVTQ